MLVMCSLYYSPKLMTGANKRFEQLALEIVRNGHSLSLVVRKGCHVPSLSKLGVNYIEVPNFPFLKRVFDIVYLSVIFFIFHIKKHKLISDYNPIPPTLFFSSNQYQLIHDARLFDSFQRWGRFSSFLMKLQWRSLNKVVTVSNFTKESLVERMAKIERQNVVVSYNGLSDEYFSPTLDPKKNRDIDIFYLATFEERKNHKALIMALDLIADHCNVILLGRDLGTKPDILDLLKMRCQQHTVSLIESTDEQSLLDLYARTKLFVSPSLYEGFGMPLIEAKLRGCQVCCSDIPVFREVMAEDAVYFDPYNIQLIGNCIIEQLATYDSMDIVLSHKSAVDRLKYRYSWHNIAARLVDDLSFTYK